MNKIDIKNLYVIADFDHTLTTHDSKSSWGVLETSKSLPRRCIEECEKYRKYYLPIENDYTIPFNKKSELMKEWCVNNLNLFIKYKMTENDINKVSSNKKCMKLRKGVKNFLKFTNNNNIPVIIISAGITNVIKNFLKANKCLYNNIYIISNIIKYTNGIITGFKNESIYSLNKHKTEIPNKIKEIISNKKSIMLLGDNIGDTLMAPKSKDRKIIKIGFLNNHPENYEQYKNAFDIVYKDNSSFDKITRILKKS